MAITLKRSQNLPCLLSDTPSNGSTSGPGKLVVLVRQLSLATVRNLCAILPMVFWLPAGCRASGIKRMAVDGYCVNMPLPIRKLAHDEAFLSLNA
jgi:hypothetical protein